MKKANITEGKWKWQKFGEEYYLCGQHGMRPMVLATLDGKIAVRKHGLLEELYPEHPDAKAISAVPEMMNALKMFRDYFHKNYDGLGIYQKDMLKRANKALKKAGCEDE